MLLTFVDSSGANRRVQGSFPLSDGTAVSRLQTAKVSRGRPRYCTKVLGVDSSGRSVGPVEVAPVEDAPGP